MSQTADAIEQIRQNVGTTRELIATAAARDGRTAGDVELVAVTKYVDLETTRLFALADVKSLGESRPQVLWKKAVSLNEDFSDLRWHLVGHLQSNKVKRTLRCVDLIHSIDRESLLVEIAKEVSLESNSRQSNRSSRRENNIAPCDVLVEVNISGDTNKSGVAMNGAAELVEKAMACDGVRVGGLMGMSGLGSSEDEKHRQFEALRDCFQSIKTQFDGSLPHFRHLSMGMSGDFEIAIEHGATMVRIGSRLMDGI